MFTCLLTLRSKSTARKEGLTGVEFKDVAGLGPILSEVLEVVEVRITSFSNFRLCLGFICHVGKGGKGGRGICDSKLCGWLKATGNRGGGEEKGPLLHPSWA